MSDEPKAKRAAMPDRRIEFRREQVQALLNLFGGDDETLITVTPGDASSHSGPGLYAYITDYPEEGAMFLGPEGEVQP